MFSGIIRRLPAAVTAVVFFISAAVLPGHTAAADPDQDQKFFDLLGQKEIPPVDNANSLIATAHKACSKLDGGMSVGDLTDLIRNNGYKENPLTRLDPGDRITRTINQFIIASVEAYCPYDRGKIASIAAYRATPSGEPTYRVTDTRTTRWCLGGWYSPRSSERFPPEKSRRRSRCRCRQQPAAGPARGVGAGPAATTPAAAAACSAGTATTATSRAAAAPGTTTAGTATAGTATAGTATAGRATAGSRPRSSARRWKRRRPSTRQPVAGTTSAAGPHQARALTKTSTPIILTPTGFRVPLGQQQRVQCGIPASSGMKSTASR